MEYELGTRLDRIEIRQERLEQKLDMIINHLSQKTQSQKKVNTKAQNVVEKTIPPPIDKKPVQKQEAPIIEDDDGEVFSEVDELELEE